MSAQTALTRRYPRVLTERLDEIVDDNIATVSAPILLCEPHLGGREREYLQQCLDSNWLSSSGPFVDRFEREFAQQLQVEHAVAMSSGTAALHLALLAAGVGPGDEVLVSSLTFVAPVNAIRYCGAFPVFVDADPETWQMDGSLVEAFLAQDCEAGADGLRNRRTGRRIAALLPVHILGHPVDMAPVLAAADRHGLSVVEDATESLGARWQGIPVGKLGHIAAFSFNGNKLLTTGGGGMAVTGDAAIARRIRHLATQAKADPIEYVHDEVGFNYRMPSLQAAIGCAQLERIDGHLAAKARIANRYNAAFSTLPNIAVLTTAAWAESARWLYTIRVLGDNAGRDSRALLRHLAAAGVQTRPLWQPLHLGSVYGPSAAAEGRILGGAVAERLYAESLSLPCSVGLTERDQDYVIRSISEFVS
jgi:perosamine synthetase